MFCFVCGEETYRLWAQIGAAGELLRAKFCCHGCGLVFCYDVAARTVEIDTGMRFQPAEENHRAALARGRFALVNGRRKQPAAVPVKA